MAVVVDALRVIVCRVKHPSVAPAMLLTWPLLLLFDICILLRLATERRAIIIGLRVRGGAAPERCSMEAEADDMHERTSIVMLYEDAADMCGIIRGRVWLC